MNYTRDKTALLKVYFLFYYIVFLFFFINHRLLSQVQPILFNYNRDLSELLLIAAGLPRFMIGHPWTFFLADALLYLLPVPLLIYAVRKGRFSSPLGIAFSLFIAVYLLLANIFWQNDHEPFVLYILLSFAFLTNREERFYALLKGARYYFLYIFFSAAIWKIARGAVFNVEEMSNILLIHHSELLSGNGASAAARCYVYLIDHPGLSWLFYLGGVLLELSFAIGFFTRRFDRVLLGLAILFVTADLLLMRIPYWTILLGGVTLWLASPAASLRRPKGGERARARDSKTEEWKILIYETTHHENLPALLDLSEVHFSKITVFLKEISYRNLSGADDLTVRWPKTEFVVQEAGCHNRAFIRQLFIFLRRHSCSHLHLSTLDNNLLVFALRLAFLRDVHVSLTIHAVNDYFTFSFASPKDLSESMAKYCLHRQVRHYTFFLPAMADRFRERLPGCTAVYIPSRFYEPAAPADTGKEDAFFRIIIPGSVDPNRRDYAEVASFLANYLSRTAVARGIELVILGDSDTAYGRSVVQELRQLESPRFRLSAFNGYVPATVYEEQFSGADLIWSPLNAVKTSTHRSPETYGLTIASGLTADLQLGCAPVLAPAWLTLPDPFRVALLSYFSREDSAKILDDLLQDPAYSQQLRHEIHAAFDQLNLDNFRAAFQQLMALSDPKINHA
jgi:hypothetical protein